MNEAMDAFALFDPRMICMDNEEIRTKAQNDWIHPVFRQIAQECQGEGITQKILIKKLLVKGDYPVSETFVKELFKSIMFAITGKKSTTKLDKKELSDLMDTFILAVDMRLGIKVEKPDVLL